jgi:hypothetical protein
MPKDYEYTPFDELVSGGASEEVRAKRIQEAQANWRRINSEFSGRNGLINAIANSDSVIDTAYIGLGAGVNYALFGGGMFNDIADTLKSDAMPSWYNNSLDYTADVLNAVPNNAYDLGLGINRTLDNLSESLGFDLHDDRYFEEDLLNYTGYEATGFGKYVARPILGPIGLFFLGGGALGASRAAAAGVASSEAAATAAAAGRAASVGRWGLNVAKNNFVTKGGAAGLFYDFVTSSPEGGTATDALIQHGIIDQNNYLADILGTDREDPWYVNQFKGMVEGGLIGSIFEGGLDAAVLKPLGYVGGKLFDRQTQTVRFIAELNQDSAKSLAERGLISPEEAELIARNKIWEIERFKLNTKSRLDVEQKMAEAYGKDYAETVMPVMDRMFAYLAVEGKTSLEDVYSRSLAGINVEDMANDSGEGFSQLARILRQPGDPNAPEFNIAAKPTGEKRASTLGEIDRLKAYFADKLTTPKGWTSFFSSLYKGQKEGKLVPSNPTGLINQLTQEGYLASTLKKITKGQYDQRTHGLQNGIKIREGYAKGIYDQKVTAKLALWGILSRMLSPYRHEAAAVDAFVSEGLDEILTLAGKGELEWRQEYDIVYDEDVTFDEITGKPSEEGKRELVWKNDLVEKWLKTVIPAGSAGKPGTANMNSYGREFLYKMSQKGADGKTYLQKYHDIISDARTVDDAGNAINGRSKRRRILTELPEGHGIGIKVHSFILLVTGHHDVAILDRVQLRNLWSSNTGGEDDLATKINLYDGRKIPRKFEENVKTGKSPEFVEPGPDPKIKQKKGESAKDFKKRQLESAEKRKQAALEKHNTVTIPEWEKLRKQMDDGLVGDGLSKIAGDFKSLTFYETIEEQLEKILKREYSLAGDMFKNDVPTVGMYHWDTWNAGSNQEAGHSSLDYLFDTTGTKRPTSREGRYAAIEFGNIYDAKRGTVTIQFPDENGNLVQREVLATSYGDYREKAGEIVNKIWSQQAKKAGKKATVGGILNEEVVPELSAKPWYQLVDKPTADKLRKLILSVPEANADDAVERASRARRDGRTAVGGGPSELGQPDPGKAGRRGRVRFLEDLRAVISLFKNTDPKKSYDRTTFMHEIGHVFRRQASVLAPEFHAEMVKAFNVKDGANWTEAEEELFTSSWEKYLSSGKAPVPELATVFEKFKGWFESVYNGILNSPMGLSLTQDQRDIYDRMLGKGWNRANPGKSRPPSPTGRAVPAITQARSDYIKNFPNAPRVVGGQAPQFNEELSKKIADAYDEMVDDYSNPEVKKSYDALVEETLRQYEYLKSLGYRMVPDQANGYSSSAAMMEDLETNKRLYVFKTIAEGEENTFGATGGTTDPNKNPLLKKTGEVVTDSNGNPYELTVNDVFRFVHDVFGHASDGVTFGPKGEERAWLSHAQMFSRDALPAMTSETRGQNSWVNSGKHMRRPDGSIPKMGDPDYIPQEMTGKDGSIRQYAKQKVGLLPSWAWDHPNLDDPTDPVKFVQRVKETFDEAMKSATNTAAALEYSLRQHINFDRINTEEDVTNLLKMYEPLFGALRLPDIKDVLTLKDIEEMAKEMSLNPKQVIEVLSGQRSNIQKLAPYLVSLRILQNSAAIAMRDAATQIELKAARGEPLTMADRDLLLNTRSTLEFIGKLRADVQRGVAVAVTSGNIPVGAAAGENIDIDSIAEAASGGNSPQARSMRELARKAAKDGDAALASWFESAAASADVSELEARNSVRRSIASKIESAKQKKKVEVESQKSAEQAAQEAMPKLEEASAEPTSLEGVTQKADELLNPEAAQPSAAIPTPSAGGGVGGAAVGGQTAPVKPAPSAPVSAGSSTLGMGTQGGTAPLPVPNTGGLTAQQSAQLLSIARAFVNAAATNQTQRLSSAVAKAAKTGSSVLNIILEHHKAFLLSGIPTFGINVASGAMMTVMQPLYRTVGAIPGAIFEKDIAELRNGFRMMASLVGAFADMFRISNMTRAANLPGNRGLNSVYRTIRSEMNTLTKDSATEPMGVVRGKNFIDPNTKSGLKKIASKGIDIYGRILRLPFTFNQSAEEFFTQINYNAFIRMKALEAADKNVWDNPSIPNDQKERMAGAFIDTFMKDAYDNIGAASLDPNASGSKFMHADAVQYAKSAMFAQDLSNGFGDWLHKGVEKFPLMKLIVPFVKAPTNLIRHAMSMVPGVGMIEMNRVKSKLAGMPITGESKDELLRLKGQMLMGSAFCAMAGYLVATGKITGSGPTNKEERNVLLSSGWRPYSFVVQREDGTTDYIEYRRADPYSSVLGLVADFVESRATLDEDEAESVAARIVYSLGRNFVSKTYLTGLSQFFEAITDSRGYAAQKWVQSFTGSFVPAALARYTQAVSDPTMRETREWYDGVLRRLPGYSETLPPRRNILGEVMVPNPGWVGFNDIDSQTADRVGTFVSPIGFSKRTGDTVKEEMASLRYGFSPPQYMMGEIDLRRVKRNGRDAYDVMFEKVGTVKIGGKTLEQKLDQLFSTTGYKKQPRPESNQDSNNGRVQMINSVLAQYRAKAKADMLKEFPELVKAYRILETNSNGSSASIDILESLSDLK